MPAVRAIKAGRPDAHITVAAPEKIAPVWKLVPEVDEVISLKSSSLFSAVRLIRQKRPFDVAILFPNSLRAALEVWQAGVSRRVAYRGHHRRWLLNQVIPERPRLGPVAHQRDHYLQITREVGGPTEPPAVRTFLPRAKSNGTITKVGLCPGAEYGPAKRWFPERFAEVAVAVSAQRPVEWILFGTPSDARIGANIEASVGNNCINRIGKTSEMIIDIAEVDQGVFIEDRAGPACRSPPGGWAVRARSLRPSNRRPAPRLLACELRQTQAGAASFRRTGRLWLR